MRKTIFDTGHWVAKVITEGGRRLPNHCAGKARGEQGAIESGQIKSTDTTALVPYRMDFYAPEDTVQYIMQHVPSSVTWASIWTDSHCSAVLFSSSYSESRDCEHESLLWESVLVDCIG